MPSVVVVRPTRRALDAHRLRSDHRDDAMVQHQAALGAPAIDFSPRFQRLRHGEPYSSFSIYSRGRRRSRVPSRGFTVTAVFTSGFERRLFGSSGTSEGPPSPSVAVGAGFAPSFGVNRTVVLISNCTVVSILCI